MYFGYTRGCILERFDAGQPHIPPEKQEKCRLHPHRALWLHQQLPKGMAQVMPLEGIPTSAPLRTPPVCRCARLIMGAVHEKLPEAWISSAPPMIMMYLNWFAPPLFRLMMNRMVQKQLNDAHNAKARRKQQ